MKKFLVVMLALLLVLMSCCTVLCETAASTQSAEYIASEAVNAESTAVPETAESSTDEESTDEEQSWISQWQNWVVLSLLLFFCVAMCIISGVKWTSRRLAYAAMTIAISFVLSLITVYHMPQGGSITLISKLPLILFAVACGPAYGLVAGFALGLISLIYNPYVIHPIQLLVDYPFASGAVALACVANYLPIKKDNVKLAVASVFGYLGSYIMAVLSGAIFFGEYAWEGYSAWGYSLAYNATYCWPECAICVIIVLAVPGISNLVKMIGKKN